MIKKVELRKFKRFRNQVINLKTQGITVLAGGNNSGKSTLLHAIAVWEFCKLIIRIEKGAAFLYQENEGQGLGLSAEEFLPIAIPSLKHMWTNLKTQKEGEDIDGYNLKIKCFWDLQEVEKFLEISLSLANDRLFVKVTDSNITDGDKIPNAAYLPTFAGILERENKVSLAERRKLIGKGLAGSVLRNLLLELYDQNKAGRVELKGDKAKIRTSDLKRFKTNDPFEILVKNIRDIFRTGFRIKDFNDLYHTSIKIDSFKGEYTDRGVFKKHSLYNYRDLMVEGSGFLQWLNVFTLSLNTEIDILLLDEPDAHLHPSLQHKMIKELEKISGQSAKQILIATHSSEIIKVIEPNYILNVTNSLRYLHEEGQKVGLLAGIGSDYSPVLDKIKRTKKILFVEGEIDYKLLCKVGELIGSPISDDVVDWISASSHKERKLLFNELKKEIPDLKGLSIRDRDDEGLNSVDNDLVDKGHSNQGDDFRLMKWKRRNIENYLILPSIIESIVDDSIVQIKQYIADIFALAIPQNFLQHDIPEALARIDGKNIIKENQHSICNHYNISRWDIIENMNIESICEDLTTMVQAINQQFNE